MSVSDNTKVPCKDLWVTHPHGRMFVRVWEVATLSQHTALSPIVLFHDSLGCVELWRDFPARLALATGRSVIAYDRLGFGRSGKRSGCLPLDFIAGEAATYFPALRRQLGFGRFVAFGHSVGGGMAAHCAARYASQCDMLITESAQAFVEERTVHAIRAAKEMFADPVQFARLERYHGEKAGWVLQAWTETWLSHRFAKWELADEIGPIVVPAMVMHGSLDEFGSARQPERIAQICTGRVRLDIIPDTCHVPHRERPIDVLARVCDFLAAR